MVYPRSPLSRLRPRARKEGKQGCHSSRGIQTQLRSPPWWVCFIFSRNINSFNHESIIAFCSSWSLSEPGGGRYLVAVGSRYCNKQVFEVSSLKHRHAKQVSSVGWMEGQKTCPGIFSMKSYGGMAFQSFFFSLGPFWDCWNENWKVLLTQPFRNASVKVGGRSNM